MNPYDPKVDDEREAQESIPKFLNLSLWFGEFMATQNALGEHFVKSHFEYAFSVLEVLLGERNTVKGLYSFRPTTADVGELYLRGT